MHDARLACAAREARQGTATVLAHALAASRADTLATFEAFERALPGLRVPQRAGLNPPLWELGHVGWFQEYWIARNPTREQGEAADPETPRHRAHRSDADALYDSSRVPHASRWSLDLPDAQATRDDLRRQLEGTLALLACASSTEAGLYFFRLALFHEDMHHEAALYMARGLGIAIDDCRWQPRALPEPRRRLSFDAGRWRLGDDGGAGFAFDNERPGLDIELPACEIDAQVVRWAEYLPFIESGGYAQSRWWSDEGAVWRSAQDTGLPRYLRRGPRGWEQWVDARWQRLDPAQAACHLTLHEAEAWCRWAGRRLPTEGEWERAAITAADCFRWGDAWEWTASPFAPFPGFRPHPYRDYSMPWFDGRPVLRGASHCTQPRLRHPRYRNFFPPDRSDVPAGFRTCAV